MPSASSRNNLVLLAVLAVLVVLALVTEGPWFFRRETAPLSPVVFSGASDQVDRIDVEGPAGKLSLKKEKGAWLAGTGERWFRADREMAGQVVDFLDGLNGGTVVSRNPSRRSSFQVDDQGALGVAVLAGGRKVADFLVGGQGPDLFGGYVRPRGADEVVLVKGNIRPLLEKPVASWRDMDVLPFAAGDARAVDLALAADRLILGKDKDGWVVSSAGGGKADPAAVDDLLARLSGLRAVGVLETPPGEKDFEQPAMRLEVSLADGGKLSLTAARRRAGQIQHEARRDGEEAVYLLSDISVEEIGKAAARLAGGKK